MLTTLLFRLMKHELSDIYVLGLIPSHFIDDWHRNEEGREEWVLGWEKEKVGRCWVC